MALSVVNSTDKWNGGNVVSFATPAIATTAGNLLVVGYADQSASTWTQANISNTGGDTWRAGDSFKDTANSNINTLYLFYAYNIAGNAADVITINFGGANASAQKALFVFQVHSSINNFTADPKDGAAVHAGAATGTALNSGAVTVTGNDIIFAIGTGNGFAAGFPGTGYTGLRDSDNSGGGGNFFGMEYHIVNASESATMTATSGKWEISALGFKEPSVPIYVPKILGINVS